MISALTYGIREGVKHWRAGLVVYALLLSLAATIGIQVYHVLEASIGNSLELNRLIKQYDHTVIQDFLRVHGASVSPLFGQLRWYLIIYLIFSIFINAGLIHCVVQNDPKSDWKNFWNGGAHYFFPFLIIGATFLLMFAFWTGVIAVPALIYVQKIFPTSMTEMPMYWVAGVATILVFIYWMIIISWSINTKLSYMRSDKPRVWTAIKEGFKMTKQKLLSSPRLFLLFVIFQLIVVVFHLYIEGIFGMTSTALIVFFFITQQLLIFFRILWRLMVYEGFDKYNFETTDANTNLNEELS